MIYLFAGLAVLVYVSLNTPSRFASVLSVENVRKSRT